MFDGATSFNQDISGWNVSNVENMSYMFRRAVSFNQDISGWDVSNLSPYYPQSDMFTGATSFNQNLSRWKNKLTAEVYYYILNSGGRFKDLLKPESIPNNLIKRLIAKYLNSDDKDNFTYNNKFYGRIGTWDVSNITNMNHMFQGASSFNEDISGWDVSNVNSMMNMFKGASSFNQNLSRWKNKLKRSALNSIFRNWGTRFKDLLKPELITDNHLLGILVDNYIGTDDKDDFTYNNKFYGRIGTWDVSNITKMNDLFAIVYLIGDDFNEDISKWDVSKVEDMTYMFRGAESFNQDISGWDVSKVKDMEGMFERASSFNQDISGWDVSKVKDMSYMFDGATSFNQNLSRWKNKLTSDARNSILLNSGGRFKDLVELYTNERYNIPIDSYSIPTNTNKIMSSRAKIVYNF